MVPRPPDRSHAGQHRQSPQRSLVLPTSRSQPAAKSERTPPKICFESEGRILCGRSIRCACLFEPDLTTMDQWQRPVAFTSTPPAHHSPIYQPLHPSLRPLLDPEYVAFHENCVQYLVPDEQMQWDATTRSQLPTLSGGSMPLRVGSIRDVQLENCRVRVFVPESSQEVAKYPVLYWLHGGGWVTGNLESGNDFLTYICQCE